MNCEQANQIDIVDFLARHGFQPARHPKPDEYWYLSPLPHHTEKTASFKVERNRNTWKDFGTGEGGSLVDLGMLMYGCTEVEQVLEKLSSSELGTPLIKVERRETTPRVPQIKILETRPITSPTLLSYIRYRCIPLEIANLYLQEVSFQLREKKYYSLGFKNNAGGYELRNAFYKASSFPKDITLLENGQHQLAVFEGFFNFLSFAAHQHVQGKPLPAVLVMNSTSLFGRSLPIMEGYRQVELYLDNDMMGRWCAYQLCGANGSSGIYKDCSNYYNNYEDYNDWWMKIPRAKRLRPGGGKGQRF